MKLQPLTSHFVAICFIVCLTGQRVSSGVGSPVLDIHGLTVYVRDEQKGYGPIFEEQPIDTVYPEESPEGRVTMNCRARGIPTPTYKWQHNNWDIDIKMAKEHHIMVGGNLEINNPEKSRDEGKYVCIAYNVHGTIRSREATLNFGYLYPFTPEERHPVKVKEGVGAVLLCNPPPHYPDDLSYRWVLNDFPEFITLDKRRYVSQSNGNLYIAKVEASDKGNYSCFVTSNSITKSVFSSFIPLIPQADRSKGYLPDIRVKFKDIYALLGQNVTLECFALGNPVPEIRWNKYLEPMPTSAEISMSGAVLRIYNIQFEDEGTYECEAENHRGKDKHSAKVYVQAYPEWVEHINDTERDLGSEFHWPCVAAAKPLPTIRWLKDGIPYWKGDLRFSSLKNEDSGMYQCVAENIHGMIYSNAELKVIVLAPTFEYYPMKKEVLAARGGQAIIECKPRAAPRPKLTWSKGAYILKNTTRTRIWYDGSLEILNVTAADAGNYTCFVENFKGKANSSSTLVTTAPTRIDLAPTNIDVIVGQNATLQCHALHDPSLDLTFIWLLNGYPVDVDKESDYYERSIMIKNNGELIVKYAQLRHAGRYTCVAQTIVDNATASADLVVRGPPGPPGGLKVEEIKNTSVVLTWSRGTDNHSPISNYTIQSRTFLSEYWKDMKTDPPLVEGNVESAKVIDLIPWMEYEFRIMATNILGTGEPSMPSPIIQTEGSPPNVAPSEVGGGGGSNRELTITWVPLPREYHFGNNFGYVVAFKSFDQKEWKRVTVPQPEIGRYVHKDESMPPSSRYQVKVRAFNNKGEGPFSLTAIIHSAEDAPSERPRNVHVKVRSSTEAVVSWEHIFNLAVTGYEIRYWSHREKEDAANRVQVSNLNFSARLENLKPDTQYYTDVKAFNTAGFGPATSPLSFVTEKAPPRQRPRIVSVERYGSKFLIKWDHVKSQSNESSVKGYKVLYRPDGQFNGTLFKTGKHFIEVPAPLKGQYVVEVRVHSEGGDGEVAQVKIPGAAVGISPSCLGLLLPAVGILVSLGF
ncbi:contactin-1 [Anolis carolinensis]|uniref:Contactin 1 n=1 Tax=Anolis carolinensis TaxID=28377 RepID=G1KSH9_ANOCA|nr:PREDICTED: contactin-1 [Anolis carolinensis]|eukprot:XP_008109326.1 PREDICTED: contactin-1 [Anolis carolinensis]